MATLRRAPISLVLFDAFDTLVTPRTSPHLQYAEEFRKVGLEVSNEEMRVAFKTAFKEMASNHPIYGLHTGLKSPDEWWTRLIELCLQPRHHESGGGDGMSSSTLVRTTLAPNLLSRFSSDQAYRLADGALDVFDSLAQLQRHRHGLSDVQVAAAEPPPSMMTTTTTTTDAIPPLLRWNLATNSDSRILSVCAALGLDHHLDLRMGGGVSLHGQRDYRPPQSDDENDDGRGNGPPSEPSLSYFLGFEKPHPTFFHRAVERSFSAHPSPSSSHSLAHLCAQTVYVGDDFNEDYLGAKQAGLQAVWLKRSQQWPEGLNDADRDAVVALDSLDHLGDYIRQSWST